eukprot:6487992-Amphidinium_carterae.1
MGFLPGKQHEGVHKVAHEEIPTFATKFTHENVCERFRNSESFSVQFVAILFAITCGAPTAEEREQQRELLLQAWQETFLFVDVRFVEDAARADDCSAYLAFLVDHYEAVKSESWNL